ncbi:MAG: hypothetical protein KKE05_00470 [Nanoarchaeota archaeon]|nr:hypothetical protein [Nanoarchaeota archaeon]
MTEQRTIGEMSLMEIGDRLRYLEVHKRAVDSEYRDFANKILGTGGDFSNVHWGYIGTLEKIGTEIAALNGELRNRDSASNN